MRIFARSGLIHRWRSFSRLSVTGGGKSDHDYCVELVRKYDHENYLISLLLAKEHRRRAFALRAFNIEVSNVEHHAKEEPLKQMRLKFWEDTVTRIFSGNPPDHPVAVELYKVLKTDALSKNFLYQLIRSRAEKFLFQSTADMESYAEKTSSPIYYVQLISCGVQNLASDHAFSHLGKGQGITNLLRSVPFYAQRQTVILPQDLLTKYKISQEVIIRGQSNELLRNVVFEVASLAHSHLGKARSLMTANSTSFHRHFLSMFPSLGYLERLRKVDFDLFHPKLQLRDNLLPLKLLWRSWFIRYF